MDTFYRKDLFKPAGPLVYISAVVISASAWAMPVTDGGLHNLASWTVWAFAWFATVVFTLAIFAKPIDQVTETPKTWEIVSRIASWGAVGWLAYHGEVTLPAMLAYSFFMGHVHRRRAIEANSA